MWYGAAEETTELVRRAVGAPTADQALYGCLGLDYKTIRPAYHGPPMTRAADGTWVNEWGVTRGGAHYGVALTAPLAGTETAAEVEAYPSPDPDWWEPAFSPAERAWAEGYCVIGGYWSPIFHDAAELLGMEEFFLDLYDNEPVVRAVLEKCEAFYAELDERIFAANAGLIDFYFLSSDFGTQQSLLLSPDLWRRYFKPPLARIVTRAKAAGLVVGVHSCGAIREIIGDLIEIGVDAINPIQVSAAGMDPADLVREFRDEVVFWGGIDETGVLLHGTEKEVRAETRRILDTLGQYGRYIVAASHDLLLPEVPAANIIAMYDEAAQYRP
jgi:uroporphyrinogen decarboxylase